MKVTVGRWIAAALVGCLALAVAILPADGSSALDGWLARRDRTPVDMWETRLYARQGHLGTLINAYDAARDLAAARKAFGTTPGTVGDPEVRFADGVPPAMRRAFTRALDDERAQRPEWKGRGKVGVLVLIDTVTRVNDRTLPMAQNRFTVTTSRVVAPDPQTGGRCVTVVGLPGGDPWSSRHEMKPLGPPHPLLDGCGFYDAFGAPGAAIARDLADDQFFYARGYAWMTAPRDSARHPGVFAFQQYPNETREVRCLAGNDTSCVDEFRGVQTDLWWDTWWATVTAPAGISTRRAMARELPYPDALNRIVLELGPQRFFRMWQSAKTLDAAYRDESGETLGEFVRRSDIREDGAYRPGALKSWLATGLTLAAIASCLALALQFSVRPRVA